MGTHDPVPTWTPEQEASAKAKQQRLLTVLQAYWKAHPDEAAKSLVERAGQVNKLYSQLYPGASSADCVECESYVQRSKT